MMRGGEGRSEFIGRRELYGIGERACVKRSGKGSRRPKGRRRRAPVHIGSELNDEWHEGKETTWGGKSGTNWISTV
jgi:hypothetical protein